jgi:predicted flap endonuclease-1-like 5' DNA nuclease
MNRKNILLGLIAGIAAFITAFVLIYILIPLRKKRLNRSTQQGFVALDNNEQITIDQSEDCEPDDLTHIDGIGSKISGALLGAGITRIAQIATMQRDDIQAILDMAGVKAVARDEWIIEAREIIADS